MLTLYDNPFSPFARKVRMALRFKRIAFDSVDALAVRERERLTSVNPRAEVPVLVDGDLVVVDSADIVAYLEDRFPTPALLPSTPRLRAEARRWQRLADGLLDAVVHDISLWVWPTHRRSDRPPAGLLEAGRRDLETALGWVEDALRAAPYLCGGLSIADLALFPHLSSLRPLGIVLDASRHPSVLRWMRAMRSQEAVRADLDHVRRSLEEKFARGASPYEGEKVVWRGDRIEWLLANGFHDWLASELAAGRAVVPRWAAAAGSRDARDVGGDGA